jgi:hypothetical protein
MRKIALILAVFLVAFQAKAEDVFRPISTHWLDFDSVSVATTNPIGNFIQRVRLVCTTACYYSIASSGLAAVAATRYSTTGYLPADNPVTFVVSPGSKIAAIKVSSAGRIYITELSK